MKRKITRFARGRKCGAIGASGLFDAALAPCSPLNANQPKPAAALRSISRRVRKDGCMGLLNKEAQRYSAAEPQSNRPRPRPRPRNPGSEGRGRGRGRGPKVLAECDDFERLHRG